MAESTPMMAQYQQIKEQHRDAVLFFRLGDFYEMFNEDAVEVSRLLNLTLTHRAGSPMCGIPYHASKIYIARLLRAGKKIAICEQLSIPGPGKGLADRKVIEVVTPGTAVEDDYLDQTSNNYLAALSFVAARGAVTFGFAYIDVSTGEFAATSFDASGADERIRKELGRIQPKEILVQQSALADYPFVKAILDEYPAMVQNRYPDWSFNAAAAFKRLCSAFSTSSLQAFSLVQESPEVPPAGLLLEYLEHTSGAFLSHISGIRSYGESEFVSIDDSTRKNLELVQNLRDGSSSYTLFEVLNQTRTVMGARLLRSWIQHPLTDRASIEARLARVELLYRSQKMLSRVRELLSGILDIERLAGRVAMERAHAKDLLALKQSLDAFIRLHALVDGSLVFRFSLDDQDVQTARDLFALVDSSICEDAPIQTSDGGLIKDGWSTKLDELRSLRDNSNQVLEAYLAEEREKTGIANLKIRYNRLLGYYLEVSKGNLPSVPAHFIRRRSLANGDRYTTDRLVELETELNGVHANIIECEQNLFLEIRSKVFTGIRSLLAISRELAAMDVLQSFATAATMFIWVKPEFTDTGALDIAKGRHPVVEAHLPTGEFVPNSISLSSGEGSAVASFALITGPNMAGKSTFLRQTALIAVMAQIGSFVPAESACLTPVDRVFCRVGASDNLARGESTFLVEMTETAHILRSATRQSLVIMDEVGRGTSTEDGLSIARAVTEYLLDTVGAKTLFATHYHELSRLEHPRLAGYCLDVLETEGTVVFLKKVRAGASANSYGIHVARLAGVPEPVLGRAAEILSVLVSRRDASVVPLVPGESGSGGTQSAPPAAAEPTAARAAARLPQLFSEEELVLEEILSLDTDAMTPLDALRKIDDWKKKLYPAK
jgi:DNA mismatch repair protein MutS